MGNARTPSGRRRDGENARNELEALHHRNRPATAYCGVHHSLDEQLRLVGLIKAFGGSLSELARELQLPLDYVCALEAYHDQWES
jgi:hypothetical protein